MKFTKSIYCLLSLITITLLSCQSNNKTVQKEAPLNVVLITLDDMGYGTTGVEGSSVPDITPYIDKLASEGITFTHGYVMSPMCGPSRAAILSGRYPHCSGMMGHGTMPPALWQEPEAVFISKTGAMLFLPFRWLETNEIFTNSFSNFATFFNSVLLSEAIDSVF